MQHDPKRLQLIRRLFDDALQQPAEEREAFVREHALDADVADEVLRMLAADEVADTGAIAAGVHGLAAPESPLLAERIGPYRLLGELGRGGMGVVYRAERADLNNHVAIKVSQQPPGLSTEEVLQRFEFERRSLAAMNHRCIAKVFDAGTTEQGQPYFVMELVDGMPLNQ